MEEFLNKFSWSKSRDSLFNECKKRYYFEKYGSWGGWNEDAPEKVRELYILKKLISKEIWIGQVVHDIIKNVLSQLKLGNELSLSYALNLLKKRLEKDYNDSKSGIYRERFVKAVGLFEHEYELLIPKDEWDELFKKAEKCIINFYNSDTFQNIKKIDPSNWVILEDFSSFEFEGTKVFLKIDFVVKEGNNIILFDWKTGRERHDEMDVQLCCYALYIMQKYNIKPEKIITKKYNLTIDKIDEFQINKEAIERIKDYIRESIKSMKEMLVDKEKNIPKDEGEFPETEERYFCGRCSFRRICKK